MRRNKCQIIFCILNRGGNIVYINAYLWNVKIMTSINRKYVFTLSEKSSGFECHRKFCCCYFIYLIFYKAVAVCQWMCISSRDVFVFILFCVSLEWKADCG